MHSTEVLINLNVPNIREIHHQNINSEIKTSTSVVNIFLFM